MSPTTAVNSSRFISANNWLSDFHSMGKPHQCGRRLSAPTVGQNDLVNARPHPSPGLSRKGRDSTTDLSRIAPMNLVAPDVRRGSAQPPRYLGGYDCS